jgi:hypothetical protein
MDFNTHIPDLVTEIQRGLRYMPGYAWTSDNDDERRERPVSEPDIMRGRSQPLDDNFWAEVDREAARRGRRQSAMEASRVGGGSPDAQADALSGGSSEDAIRILSVSYDDCELVTHEAGIFAFCLSAAPGDEWLQLFQLCRFTRTGAWEDESVKVEGQHLLVYSAMASSAERFTEVQEDFDIVNALLAEQQKPKPSPEDVFRQTLDGLQARLQR